MDGTEWLASGFERHRCSCARLSRRGRTSCPRPPETTSRAALQMFRLAWRATQSTKPRRSAARGDAGCPPILGATAARVITLAAGRPAPAACRQHRHAGGYLLLSGSVLIELVGGFRNPEPRSVRCVTMG